MQDEAYRMVLGTKAFNTPTENRNCKSGWEHQRLTAPHGATMGTPLPGQAEDQTAGGCRERMCTGLRMPAVDAILHRTVIRLYLQG